MQKYIIHKVNVISQRVWEVIVNEAETSIWP